MGTNPRRGKLSDQVNVVLRPFIETDIACIISTWRNSAYFGSIGEREPQAKFFRKLTREIRAIIPEATIEIACLENDPNTIVGWVVSRGTHLDWIYVKVDYRCAGIATMLIPDGIETVSPYKTKIGQAILNKKNLNKENTDGTARNGIETGTEA
jgi:ribosomal protein S18 acetylase RimI-like enzyme